MKINRHEAFILALLALGGSPLTAHTLTNAVGGWIRSTTYARLTRLQRDGLVRAQWVDGSYRERQFAITTAGLACLSGYMEAAGA